MSSSLSRILVQKFRKRVGNPGFKSIQKIFYELVYSSRHMGDVATYNYGYAPVNDCVLKWEHAHNQSFQIEMYNELMKDAGVPLGGLKGKSILEVSSGRGGGLAYINHAYTPGHATGLDRSSAAINAACNRFGLDYVVGDAVDLPFEDDTFDCLINVEALHGYDLKLFLSQVRRVLKPDGMFIVADSHMGRTKRVQRMVQQNFKTAGFKVLSFRDITENVHQSCVADSPRRLELTRGAPFFVRGFIREMTATEGTERFDQFRDKTRCYYIAVTQNSKHP